MFHLDPDMKETDKKMEDGKKIKEKSVKEKSRRKQSSGDTKLYIKMAAPIAVIVILLAFILLLDGKEGAAPEPETQTETVTEAPVTEAPTLSEEEKAAIELEKKKDEVIAEYSNLGIVDTEGFINMRSAADANDMTNIIGLLNDKAAFELIEDQGDWYLVESGGLTGYIASRYCVTGEQAQEMARDEMAERAVITTDVVNIRSAPEINEETVCGKARRGERYEIISGEGDWIRISSEYIVGTDTPYINISDGNAEIRLCLDEARNRDLRELALTQFENIVVCNTSYLNVRTGTSTDSTQNICGKFLKGSGAELLDTVTAEDGSTWYVIRSGDIGKGYVKADYCLTGTAAREMALEYATLTARIKTDGLNVRSAPSMDSSVWTQVTTGQAYPVIDQLDGWVEIDLESSDDDKAYISTSNGYVELTYGLSEAMKYSPAEEANRFRQRIVDYACRFIGNPYVWGGTSLTNGCDCSGFVQSVLKHYGIYIERTSADQAHNGSRVTSDRMRPGDLVFYANSSGTVNHVGMYIGDGYIVNAASRRAGIKIYKWNYRTPVAIRDVIGDRVE